MSQLFPDDAEVDDEVEVNTITADAPFVPAISKNEPINPDDLLTVNQLKVALPKKMRVHNIEGLVDHINDVIKADPVIRENLRQNLIGFSNVLQEGIYKAADYINAVKYVSYKTMGLSTPKAWAATFPERYDRLVRMGTSAKDIGSHAGAFNRSVLVNKIVEQTLVPTHILNADVFQEAINQQAILMRSAKSEKVRCDAANSLLTHLKSPTAQKIELDIGQRQNKSIDDLRSSVEELAKAQREAIEKGVPVKVIAHSKIVNSDDIQDAEYTEVVETDE